VSLYNYERVSVPIIEIKSLVAEEGIVRKGRGGDESGGKRSYRSGY